MDWISWGIRSRMRRIWSRGTRMGVGVGVRVLGIVVVWVRVERVVHRMSMSVDWILLILTRIMCRGVRVRWGTVRMRVLVLMLVLVIIGWTRTRLSVR